MNEKSLKLHKSHKILCFIVCFVIVFTITVIPSFALDEATYLGIGLPSVNGLADGEYQLDMDFTFYVNLNDPELGTLAGTATCDSMTFSIANGIVGSIFYHITSFAGTNTTEFVFPTDFISYWGIGDDPGWLFGREIVVMSYPDGEESVLFTGNFNLVYQGNPWTDILNGVMEALDVNIFGTFSYLDIVSTLAGACFTIWLLKMLAGG